MLAGTRQASPADGRPAPRGPGQEPIAASPRALRARFAWIAACALALAPACARGRDGQRAPAAAEQVAHESARDAGTAVPRATADGSQLSEAAARALLAQRFRAAGFRVRYDVPLARAGAFALTVDGYDPARRVGFEYVATTERDTDLDASERAALAREHTQRILIVDAVDAAGLDAAASRFLDAVRAGADSQPE